jgi:hypothetical protein
MKRTTVIGILVCLLIILCSCGKNEKGLVNMSTLDKFGYRAIVWSHRVYVPYCDISNNERGNQVGIVNGNINEQIYEYSNHQVDDWIIWFFASGETDGWSILMRELSVTEIPNGLHSEYSWNKDL